MTKILWQLVSMDFNRRFDEILRRDNALVMGLLPRVRATVFSLWKIVSRSAQLKLTGKGCHLSFVIGH
ncbi:hypothetical protein GNF09_05100 [Nostoc sp. UCD120]|nr:hypothetical protein [Nostoc sp. UCD120]